MLRLSVIVLVVCGGLLGLTGWRVASAPTAFLPTQDQGVLAGNIFAVLNGRLPQPFVYDTLGMMGSLGHAKAFGQLLKVRVHGFPAWFIRRTYYLLQMPGWGRQLRILIDWTFALLFRPDIVKVGLDSETGFAPPRSRRWCGGRRASGRGRRPSRVSQRWQFTRPRPAPGSKPVGRSLQGTEGSV